MTARERFQETMNFGNPGRPTYYELDCWPETYDRWHKEGYPKRAEFRTYFGLDRYEAVGVDDEINPVFAEETFENTANYIIKNDWRGVKVKLLKESRSIPYFHSFPVKDIKTFNEFKKHLDPKSLSRYPHAWDLRVKELENRDFPVYLGTGRTFGFFGPLREWAGPEALMIGFYDDPGWIHEMMDYYADFLIELSTPVLKDITPDCVHFFEDMAYRGGSLISPEFFRKFMMKPYRRVIEHFRKHNVPFLMVDCDGKVDELIPLFIELGINGMYPFEFQAGMDILEVRKIYGKNFAIWGGIDKRALARSKKDIETEVYRKVPPMLDTGGYFPMLDHETPPDVPFDNFCYYRTLIRKICEKG
ncbi:uroporphyrinogen decarboxylase family protein [Candidatus Latescibacterota bacterium]